MTLHSTLKTDVAAWIAEDDLTLQIPGFIRLAEADIRRDVRVRAMDQTTTLDVSGRSTALPDGFLSLRSLARPGTDQSLEYRTPDTLRKGGLWNDSGEPEEFTIEGDNLIVAPVPATTIALNIAYLKAFTALSGSDDTNWLLTNAYDVYLWGSLRYAAIYLEDAELEAKHEANYQKAVASLNAEQKLSRVGGSARVRYGGSTP